MSWNYDACKHNPLHAFGLQKPKKEDLNVIAKAICFLVMAKANLSLRNAFDMIVFQVPVTHQTPLFFIHIIAAINTHHDSRVEKLI